MSREQKHVRDAGLLARLQKALCALLGRPKQPERIRNPARLFLGYLRRIVRRREFEAGLRKPAKIRSAGICQERLTRSEPASHPSRSHLGIGAEAERHHEGDGELGQGSARAGGANLQMTTRGTHGPWME